MLYFLFSAEFIVMLLPQCRPIGMRWIESEGRCWGFSITARTGVAHGIFSIVFDPYLALYPNMVLCQLQMGRRKKFAMSSALSFG